MLRKEGKVYVLDLFVRVSPGATAPVTYTPMEVDAINQKGAKEESHVRLQQPKFLTAGGVSVEDKSKRIETVRPQLREHCGKQRENGSELGETDDEGDVELNG